MQIKEAVRKEGVSLSAYSQWRDYYPEFKALLEQAKINKSTTLHTSRETKLGDLVCSGFRKLVFNRDTPPHQEQWDEWFEEDQDHILILAPPESGKSTYLVDRITFEIAKNPNIRIGYISKSQPHAIKMLRRVKGILEHNTMYRTLAGDLVPGQEDKQPWRDTYFMVRTRQFQAGEDEADYTVAAFGAGTQITGSRLDIIIVDDVDDVNVDAATRARILDMLLQAAETRLGPNGKIILIGNRQGADDVYSRIIEQWEEDPDLWKINVQAAIIRERNPEDDTDWGEVVWPEKYGAWISSAKPKCRRTWCYHRGRQKGWSYECAWTFFEAKRKRLKHRFDLVYQNAPTEGDLKDFTEEMLDRTIRSGLRRGVLPKNGFIIGSMDPASVGPAAVMIYVLYRDEEGRARRRIVDWATERNLREAGLMAWLEGFGRRYRPRYWVIDRQGAKLWVEGATVAAEIRAQGASLISMSTPAGSHREAGEGVAVEVEKDISVASLSGLFMGEDPDLEIPQDDTHELRQQYLDYNPKSSKPKDLVMCHTYAERVVRDLRLERRIGMPSRRSKWLQSPYGGQWLGTTDQSGWSATAPGATIRRELPLAKGRYDD